MKPYLWWAASLLAIYFLFFNRTTDEKLFIEYANQTQEFRAIRCDILLSAQIILDNANKFDKADVIADKRFMLGCIKVDDLEKSDNYK